MFESAAAALFGAAGGLVAFAIPIAEGRPPDWRAAATYSALVASIVVGAGAGFGVWLVNNAGTSLSTQSIQTGHIAGAFLGGIGGPATLRQLIAARSAEERAMRAERQADAANEQTRLVAATAATTATSLLEDQSNDDTNAGTADTTPTIR